MAYKDPLSKKLNLGKAKLNLTGKMPHDIEPEITNMMLDARYLRQSSSLIQDALQKGFDVLQLANGDIVTTGTKTIVYQYTWDAEKGKLVKAKTEASKKAKRPTVDVESDDDEDMQEEMQEDIDA